MVTQLQEQETKQESKRIFTGLDTSRLNSTTTTQYRRPNFSEIDFEQVSTTVDTITPSEKLEIQKDKLSVSEQILNKPQTPTKVRLNARGKIILSVAVICICALMAFMIGNIVTICGLNNSISAKQQIVAGQQQIVSELNSQSNDIMQGIEQSATDNGYSQIDSSNVVQTENISNYSKPKANIEGNWFDSLCEFLSNLF